MSDSMSIRSTGLSGDEERINFVVTIESGLVKKGYISRSALIKLDGIQKNNLLDIFKNHQDRIADEARRHALINPSNEFVVLGSGDF